MITAVFSRPSNKTKFSRRILPYFIIMLVSYSVGCVLVRVGLIFPPAEAYYRFLFEFSDDVSFIIVALISFIIKASLIAIIYFMGYFSFGVPVLFALTSAISICFGQLAGNIYNTLALKGVLIFTASLLLPGIICCIIYCYRISGAVKCSLIMFNFSFSKDFKSESVDNKEFLINTLISLLIMLIISFLQMLIFKIVIYYAA